MTLKKSFTGFEVSLNAPQNAVHRLCLIVTCYVRLGICVVRHGEFLVGSVLVVHSDFECTMTLIGCTVWYRFLRLLLEY